MKKFIALFLAACLMAVPAAAEEIFVPTAVTATIGNAQNAGITPEMAIENVRIFSNEDGVEMAELRKVAEALNYTVEWNGNTQQISLINGFGEKELVFTPGSEICRIYSTHFYAGIPQSQYLNLEMPAKAESVDGTTYVPLEFLKEYLLNYNDISFSEFQPDTEFPLLGGSLNIMMPERTTYGDTDIKYSLAYNDHNSKSSTIMHFVLLTGEIVDVYAKNFFSASVGDMKTDAENLGLIVPEETAEYTVNDLTLLDLFLTNPDMQKSVLVKTPDERLYQIKILMNEKARNHVSHAEIAENILSSLSCGQEKSLENIWGLDLNLPENYEVDLSIGEYAVLTINKITPSSSGYTPSLYFNFYPIFSPDSSPLLESSIYSTPGKFLGERFPWYIMEDGSMKAVVHYGDYYHYLYTGKLTSDERREFINIVSNITSEID